MLANQNKGRKGRKQGKKSSDNDSRSDDVRNEETRKDDSKNEKQLNDNDDDSIQKSQEQSNDQAQDTNEKSESKLRKVKIILDEKYKVPKCYARFFSDEKKEKRKDPKKKNVGNKFKKSNVLIEIITDKHKKKKNKTAFKLLWNPEIYPFADKKLNDVVEECKSKFNSNCYFNDDEKSITISGCNLRELRDYVAKQYNIPNIPININTHLVPENFKINITGKLGTKEIKVKWNPKDWMDQFSKDFVEHFVSQVHDKWRYEINLELKTQNIIVYCIKKENIDKKIKYYLKDSWKMKDDQIIVQIDPRDKEPVPQLLENKNIYNNPLRKIKKMLKSKETSDPFIIKMATTIAEYRKYEKDKFKAHEIETNLRFYRSGSNVSKKDRIKNKNDDKIFNYWVTSFEFVKKNEDHPDFCISEGDSVILKYKGQEMADQGHIISYKKGFVKVCFKIEDGSFPLGYPVNKMAQKVDDSIKKIKFDDDDDKGDEDTKEDKNEENEDKNEEKEDKNEEEEKEEEEEEMEEEEEEEEEMDDDEIEEDIQENTENNNYDEFPYTIIIKPNDIILQRCALGLLLFDSMIPQIQNIIKNDQINKFENILFDVEVDNQTTFDLTNSKYLTESDKSNKDLMRHLKIDLTDSQRNCIEMSLTNYVSIIYGPPGCGKTTMIGLIVYNLLKNSNKKILICAQSNQAVENTVKFVSPIVKAINKQIIWITKKGVSFENQEDYENATEEQKCLSTYKIMQRETEEAHEFSVLQNKKWKNNKMRKEYKNDPTKQKRPVSMGLINRMDEIQRQIEKNLIHESDVVCCTSIASAKASMINFDFDIIIFDESSQASQMNSLIPLIHNPKQLILIGDHNQLDSSCPYDFKPTYVSMMQSLYRSLLDKNVQRVMLNTQFRMNRYISEFVNKEFYNNQIITIQQTEENTRKPLRNILTPIMFVDVKDGCECKVDIGSTYKNIEEADVIETILYNLKNQGISGNQVGVITPYKGQREILKNRPKLLGYEGVKISCVDSFQGTEREFIILSLVRTNKNSEFGFITDRNRINVSLTRASKGLIIVGNFRAIKSSNKYSTHPENDILIKLCKFYEEHNAVVDSTKIKRNGSNNDVDLLESQKLTKLEEQNNEPVEEEEERNEFLENIDIDTVFDDISNICANNTKEDQKIEDKFGDTISYK